jgi:hypothetical protein
MKPDSDDTVLAVIIRGEIKPDQRPHQYESGKISIPAWSLKVNGTQAKMRFDGFEKIAHISNWTNASETLACQFVATKPGRYQVSLTYCSDQAAAGSTATLNFNHDKVDFTAANTGGWIGGNYRGKKCGTIVIAKAGEQQLTIVPVANGWKNMAIKEIVLTPEK